MKNNRYLIFAGILSTALLVTGCSGIKAASGKIADKAIQKQLDNLADNEEKNNDNTDKTPEETVPQTADSVSDNTETKNTTETAKADEKDYSGLIESLDSEVVPGNPSQRHENYEFDIPKINIEGAEIDEINTYFRDRWSGFLSTFRSTDSGNYQNLDCVSTRYSWWVNDGLLNILLEEDLHPNASGWTEYYVYTIDIDNGTVLKPDYFAATFFDSQDDYNTYVRNALGNKFCNTYANAFNNGAMSFYDSFTQQQFSKTISDENIAKTIPYLNENNELCLKADVYSLAAGDHYPHLIDQEGMKETDLYTEWRNENRPDDASTEIKKNGDADNTVTINKSGDTNNESPDNKNSVKGISDPNYILPDSDKRYLTYADIKFLSLSDIQLAINEIYARHGRIFNSPDVRAYFESKSWYHGTIAPESFSESVFNDYERKNIDFLSQYR